MKIDVDFFQSVAEAPTSEWISLPVAPAHRVIHRTLPVASRDDGRPNIYGVRLWSDGVALRATATDGHRANIAREQVACPPLDAFLTRPTAGVLDALLTEWGGAFFELQVISSEVFFRFGEDVFKAPLSTGAAAPVETILPKAVRWSAIVDRVSLRRALKLAHRVDTRPRSDRAVWLSFGRDGRWRRDDNKVAVRLAGEGTLPFEFAEARVRVSTGPAELGAVAWYLVTALRTVGGDTVRFFQGLDELDPVCMAPGEETPGEESLHAVVMPVRMVDV